MRECVRRGIGCALQPLKQVDWPWGACMWMRMLPWESGIRMHRKCTASSEVLVLPTKQLRATIMNHVDALNSKGFRAAPTCS